MGLVFDKKIADSYDSWRHSTEGRAQDRSVEEILIALLDPKPGERILDIGCGFGNHLLILNRLGLDVSGIDASPYMIGRARERLGEKCTLKTATAEDLPFDDNEFDLAILINTLEFLDDPLEALREAGRVTSRKVFVGVLNSLSWHGLVKRIHGYFGDPVFRRARLYHLWEVKFLLQEAYGNVPIAWQCNRIRSSLGEKLESINKNLRSPSYGPFGSFLGVSAPLLYRLKTDSVPLKINLRRASEPLIGGKTFEDFHLSKKDDGSHTNLAA
jgi:ubiquinone/menaquinone biosynthesis C-methylase UbiE